MALAGHDYGDWILCFANGFDYDIAAYQDEDCHPRIDGYTSNIPWFYTLSLFVKALEDDCEVYSDRLWIRPRVKPVTTPAMNHLNLLFRASALRDAI
jgi:hypothetical protein